MSDKCIVFRCTNHKDQGGFVGNICVPCYTHITTGRATPTTSFLGGLAKAEEQLDKLCRETCTCAYLLPKAEYPHNEKCEFSKLLKGDQKKETKKWQTDIMCAVTRFFRG